MSIVNKLKSIVESRIFQTSVLGVILINAALFGLQTSSTLMSRFGGYLNALDQLCLIVFVIELALKIIVYNRRFCNDAWNIFDFLLVAVSFMPPASH